MAKANDKQYGGTHYQCQTIQPWDYVTANNLGYLEGTAIKYITRWRHKNGIEDIRKAIHFLEKLVEVETANRSTQLEFDFDRGHVPTMDEATRHSSGVRVAGQSSGQVGNAPVNAGHSTRSTLRDNSIASWDSFFSDPQVKRAVVGLCDFCPVDEQTGDSFPLCTGELNNIAILRENNVQSG